jgi:GR25 family glycosyltransferase involved in LPS biosynthesis
MEINAINTYCISLKKRPERRKLVTKEFNKIGLKFTFWDAVDGSKLNIPITSSKSSEYNVKGIIGCLLSHVNLIKYAKETKQEYIFVTEDDISFCEDFYKRIEIIEKEYPEFDMMYLGGHFGEDGVYKTDHKYIFKANSIAGTYGYIIRDTVYDFILNTYSFDWGIDQLLVEMVQKKFKCYAFIPFLVKHNDGQSDIVMCNVNYVDVNKYYKYKL